MDDDKVDVARAVVELLLLSLLFETELDDAASNMAAFVAVLWVILL